MVPAEILLLQEKTGRVDRAGTGTTRNPGGGAQQEEGGGPETRGRLQWMQADDPAEAGREAKGRVILQP